MYNKHRSGQIFIDILKINSFSCQESGDMYMQETSDLNIAQWLILACTKPNINCLGKFCPPYGASRGINMYDHNY